MEAGRDTASVPTEVGASSGSTNRQYSTASQYHTDADSPITSRRHTSEVGSDVEALEALDSEAAWRGVVNHNGASSSDHRHWLGQSAFQPAANHALMSRSVTPPVPADAASATVLSHIPSLSIATPAARAPAAVVVVSAASSRGGVRARSSGDRLLLPTSPEPARPRDDQLMPQSAAGEQQQHPSHHPSVGGLFQQANDYSGDRASTLELSNSKSRGTLFVSPGTKTSSEPEAAVGSA